MRRLTTIAGVAVAALALMGAPAMADGHGHASATARHAAKQHKSHDDHRARPKPRKDHQVTLTGFISATPTATIAGAPASNTATITVTVKGGGGQLHGATVTVVIDVNTVVRRKGPGRTAADLRLGDHVSVRGRLDRTTTPFTLYASRLNASPARHDDESADRPDRS